MKLELSHIPNILLIDDDEDDCRFFELAIAEISPLIAIRCLQNTDQLYEFIKSTKPSLIVIDFRLPKESGIDCLKWLKCHPEFKTIPVVMWSTGGLLNNVVNAYKAGVQCYLEKPWDLRELVDKLKSIIQGNHIEPFPLSPFIYSKELIDSMNDFEQIADQRNQKR